MKVTLMYASEKFSSAVGYLALSTDSLSTRLAMVWTHDLSIILINDCTNLPNEIQVRLTELSNKLYAGEVVGAGPEIKNIVLALNEDQVRDVINDIVYLNHAIIHAYALGGPVS